MHSINLVTDMTRLIQTKTYLNDTFHITNIQRYKVQEVGSIAIPHTVHRRPKVV